MPSFFIESSSFLQVTRTTIKALLTSNFDQIRLLAAEVAAIERLEKQWEKCCDHSSAFIFEWTFFILAGNKDIYKSLDDFKFLPNSTTDYRVECLKNQCLQFFSVAIDLILFNLQMRRKCIISWMYSNFGQIGRQTTDLAALEHPKNTPIGL